MALPGRRRISLGESWRRATTSAVEGPGLEGGDTDWLVGRLLAPLVAVWHWVVGEPTPPASGADTAASGH